MTAAERLASFARQQLRSILDLSGDVLYSSATTLRPGRVYLLGHNPGGSPEQKMSANIRRSLETLPTKIMNNYLDQSWGGRPVGASPLQVRVKWLLESLGLDPREVAASNLIFPRSQDAAASRFVEFAELCWPVHEQILDFMKPSLVIAFGNSEYSPYTFLARKYSANSEVRIPSGHGTWVCRAFVVPGRFGVVGLPHLSRYKVTGHHHVVAWIKSIIAL
jgi:hypothetical protein